MTTDMSNEDKEVLQALRADWNALGDRADALPSDDLRELDEGTRAAVGWMRDAWQCATDSDAPPIPFELVRHYRRQSRRPGWRKLAALTVLIAGAAAAALIAVNLRATSPAATSPGTGSPSAGSPSMAEANATSNGGSAIDRAPEHGTEYRTGLRPPMAAPLPTFEPDGLVPRADGVEIIQGSVRIVLIRPEKSPAKAR